MPRSVLFSLFRAELDWPQLGSTGRVSTKIGLSGLTTDEFLVALRVKFLFPPPQASAEKWFGSIDPTKPINSHNEFQVIARDAHWPGWSRAVSHLASCAGVPPLVGECGAIAQAVPHLAETRLVVVCSVAVTKGDGSAMSHMLCALVSLLCRLRTRHGLGVRVTAPACAPGADDARGAEADFARLRARVSAWNQRQLRTARK